MEHIDLIFVEKYFLLFIIYSVGGWLMEEIHCSYLEKKVVDRGFLIGPVCPIYGFGGLGMTLFLTRFQESPVTVFCMGIIICAILEYFTSYIMEKMFNARWWDYSDEKLNLNGRICIKTLIPFGIFGLIIIYLINPHVMKWINMMPLTALHIVAWTLAGIIILDLIVSMNVVSKVTSTSERISAKNPKDDTNEIADKVKKELNKSFTGQRLVQAFPDVTPLPVKIKEIAKKTADTAKREGKKIADTAKKNGQKIADNAKKSRQKIANTAKTGKEKIVETAKQSREKFAGAKKHNSKKTTEIDENKEEKK